MSIQKKKQLLKLVQSFFFVLLFYCTMNCTLTARAEPLDNLSKAESLREIAKMEPLLVIAVASIIALVVSQALNAVLNQRAMRQAMEPYRSMATAFGELVHAQTLNTNAVHNLTETWRTKPCGAPAQVLAYSRSEAAKVEQDERNKV
jgi:uncharacterized PurR-regulated membrane protein YhhQ (DUF165 family)